MNKIITFLAVGLVFFSCGNTQEESQAKEESVIELQIEDSVFKNFRTEPYEVVESEPIISTKEEDTTLFAIRFIDYNNDSMRDTMASLGFIKADMSMFVGFDYPAFEFRNVHDSLIMLTKDSISIQIASGHFDQTAYQLDPPHSPYIKTVNGKLFWGTDGLIPTRRISKISLQVGNRHYAISDSVYSDLFQPSLFKRYTNAVLTDRNELIIWMNNSDGAGSYRVIWIFDTKGEVLDRIVGYGFP
ncbi:MAG: hypothetical protein AB8F95_06740 [Bacteroidia bacterium]